MSRLNSVRSRSSTKEDLRQIDYTAILVSLQSCTVDVDRINSTDQQVSIIMSNLDTIVEGIEGSPANVQSTLHDLGACDTIAAVLKIYLQLSTCIVEKTLITINKMCQYNLNNEIITSESNINSFFTNGCFEGIVFIITTISYSPYLIH